MPPQPPLVFLLAAPRRELSPSGPVEVRVRPNDSVTIWRLVRREGSNSRRRTISKPSSADAGRQGDSIRSKKFFSRSRALAALATDLDVRGRE